MGNKGFPNVEQQLPEGNLQHDFYHLYTDDKKYHMIYVPRFSNVSTYEMSYEKELREKTVNTPRKFVNDQKDKLIKRLRKIAKLISD